MATFEEELKKREPIIKGASSFALLGKKIEIMGKENFVKGGPNIIVGNHIGTFKDIATLLKIIPRPTFFTANRMIFNKDELNYLIRRHLKIHMKNFGLLLDLVFNPLKSLVVNYVSANAAKVGTIPVDLNQGKRMAMEKCQEYLKKGKAIITLQGLGRVIEKNPNPYVGYFKRGASVLSYNMYKEEGISVPVTPIAMLGTHVPFLVPTKIRVKIGEPMYITDYLAGEFAETVDKFREALEKRVKALILDIIFLGSNL
ncbi:MAG: 1-acyl-sn-glycerol-3-phosphate acyltransferase [Candidatus Aminicenantes bacterium]|nr:MAG: 1-acyl-sn-glycerol-3-phosphate acyltransferase [Candidatus Aminicenantes bacterium]